MTDRAYDTHTVALVETWDATQGLKLGASRGPIVTAMCRWKAVDIARARKLTERGNVILTVEQIDLCEDKVVSQERLRRFGVAPDVKADWQQQMDTCRHDIRQGLRIDEMPPLTRDAERILGNGKR